MEYAIALAMPESLYPKARFPLGHPDIAQCLNNLAAVYESKGDYAKAGSCWSGPWRRTGCCARYPNGQRDLAATMNNLASLRMSQGEYSKAEPLFARVLAMREGLYPKDRFPRAPRPGDRPQQSGCAAPRPRRPGEDRAAVRALAMREALSPRAAYPNGHPDLVISLNNLASLLSSRGDDATVEPLYARASRMNEALYPASRYPEGHPDLALGLDNMASLYSRQGDYAKAEPLFARALRMYSDSALAVASYSPESMALNYLASQPRTRDTYLFVTLHLRSADAYPAVWQTKAALARVYERRHLAVLASSKEARGLWDAVLSLSASACCWPPPTRPVPRNATGG